MLRIGNRPCVRVGIEQPQDAGFFRVIKLHSVEAWLQIAAHIGKAERQERLK